MNDQETQRITQIFAGIHSAWIVDESRLDLISVAERRAVKMAKKKRLKYPIRINENIAIGLFKEQFIRLIIEEDEERKDEMFRRLMAEMERNIVPVRKLKSSPSKWKYFNKYKCNLKPSF